MTYEHIKLAVAMIAAMSWIGWFWHGIAYRGGFKEGSHTLPLLWTILLVVLTQAGCSVTPYVAARHVDPTPFAGGDDAWDLGCIGAKKRGQLQLKGGYCWNARGGNMLEAAIEWDVFEQ